MGNPGSVGSSVCKPRDSHTKDANNPSMIHCAVEHNTVSNQVANYKGPSSVPREGERFSFSSSRPTSFRNCQPSTAQSAATQADNTNFPCDEDSFESKRRRLLSLPLRVFNTVRPLDNILGDDRSIAVNIESALVGSDRTDSSNVGLSVSANVLNDIAEVIHPSNSVILAESGVTSAQCDDDSFESKRRRLSSSVHIQGNILCDDRSITVNNVISESAPAGTDGIEHNCAVINDTSPSTRTRQMDADGPSEPPPVSASLQSPGAESSELFLYKRRRLQSTPTAIPIYPSGRPPDGR